MNPCGKGKYEIKVSGEIRETIGVYSHMEYFNCFLMNEITFQE